MKVIIVGGVAAGASAAARLRRLSESTEIILLEKGSSISYANCGLPYHLGKVIPEREDLLVMTPKKFHEWFNINVRTESEALWINRAEKKIVIRHNDQEYTETYDKLLLATGAMPLDLNTPGDTDSRVHHLWTLSDMDRVISTLGQGAKNALIVGAGFIGLEVAENLRKLGMHVCIVQRGSHVLPTMDQEMAVPLAEELASAGIELKCDRMVTSYQDQDGTFTAILDNGEKIPLDVAIVAAGVKPNSKLAQESGLECGTRGHIIVNEFLQTSDSDIYAAGDAVEVVDPVFGGKTAIPLAGPANKQGRIAADNIAGGKSAYLGSYGASVVKVGRLSAGAVGLTEKRLQDLKKEYRKIYLHPMSSASYYPGASRLDMKLLFGKDGTIYGAQIVGAKGVDKRIDTISQAMQSKRKAPELGELELAYAPPFSSAKDPVNFAGFIAGNVLSGLSDTVYPNNIPADAVVLDVREPEENKLGSIPGSINVRLGDLRNRLSALDKNKLYVCCCQVGLRGYLAERILKQNGFLAANLSGGWLTWKMFHPEPLQTVKVAPLSVATTSSKTETLDVRRLPCPGPVVKLKTAMDQLPDGKTLHLLAATTFEGDLRRWAESSGNTLVNLLQKEDFLEADLVKGGVLEQKNMPKTDADSCAMILFSNDFDKAMAAMILANGMAASGMKVEIFFTFWGLSVLRKEPAPYLRKTFIERMFAWMLPKGASKLALSKMNMLGIGGSMIKKVMARQNVLSLPELIQSARDAGVRFVACEMAMNVMGIKREELIEIDEVAGVATFAELAKRSSHTLFI